MLTLYFQQIKILVHIVSKKFKIDLVLNGKTKYNNIYLEELILDRI